MNEGALNRDYAFLTGLERGVMTAPMLEVGGAGEGEKVKDKVENVEATEAGVGEMGGQEGHERRKLEKMLKDRGIEIRFAPWRGFGRAKENKTRAVA
jgi:imidazole glycerol phosphate synthase subunit HisF